MRLQTLLFLATSAAALAVQPVSVVPDNRLNEKWWQDRHEAKLALATQQAWQVVFIGDSITQGWEGPGREVWQKYYEPRAALNLGYSGDRTENVLWRLHRGELDGLKPKLVIVMIGTNNTGHRQDKPEEIAAGVKAILAELRQRVPGAKVLLLAIFPRGAGADDKLRVINDEANRLLAGLADGRRVHFLDLSSKFLAANGDLPKDVMPDLLHPQQKGYDIWAEAMEPAVVKLLGEKAR